MLGLNSKRKFTFSLFFFWLSACQKYWQCLAFLIKILILPTALRYWYREMWILKCTKHPRIQKLPPGIPGYWSLHCRQGLPIPPLLTFNHQYHSGLDNVETAFWDFQLTCRKFLLQWQRLLCSSGRMWVRLQYWAALSSLYLQKNRPQGNYFI